MQTSEKLSTIELVKERRVRLKNLWSVTLHNDDVTTMDFVVALLMVIFNKNKEDAVALMFKVHLRGKAKVAVYPKEIAETKVESARVAAVRAGFPLKITMEEENE